MPRRRSIKVLFYKTGIRTVESALNKVLAMRGTSYDFAADKIPADYKAGKQVGFIAQEMQAVMPELVKEDSEGMMPVNYIGVIPVLVEALKEQHEVIEEVARWHLCRPGSSRR